MKFPSKAGLLTVIIAVALTGCTNKENADKYTGTAECESFYITSEVTGKINEINIQQGNKISADELIVKIDSRGYKLQKDQAQGSLDTAEANYDSLPDAASDNQKKQIKGTIKQAKAQVALADLNVEKCNIKSAESGIVSDVFYHKGELVQSGSNIAKVMDVNNKYIKIYVEQSKREDIKLNDSIKLYYNDKKIGIGKIAYISPEAEFTPKNTETKSDKENTVFEVKINVPKDFKYSPGTLIDAEVK